MHVGGHVARVVPRATLGHDHAVGVGLVARGVDVLAHLGIAALNLVVVLDEGAAGAAAGHHPIVAARASDAELVPDLGALLGEVAVSLVLVWEVLHNALSHKFFEF